MEKILRSWLFVNVYTKHFGLGNHWKIDTVSTFKSFSLEFDLNAEFEETTGDGRKLKVFLLIFAGYVSPNSFTGR